MFSDGVARLFVFRLGPELFGVELGSVDEVVDSPVVQRLPDAPAAVLGVASLRGSLVTIYDPRPMLEVGSGAIGAVILFSRGERRIGFAVDDVYDTVTVESSMIARPPGVVCGDDALLGVIRKGGELIAVLDADILMDAALAQTDGVRK